MSPKYDLNYIRKKNPKLFRLAKEHIALDELESDLITYKVLQYRKLGDISVPRQYSISYNVKSIVGVDENNDPVYDDLHEMIITYPPKFPFEAPMLKMKSDAWHPNIKSSGPFKGRICSNTDNFGKGYTLDKLALRIGEFLQYKNYHAIDTPPYPEDAEVAKWVREHGEVKGFFSLTKPVDDRSLVNIEVATSNRASDQKKEPKAPGNKQFKSFKIVPKQSSAQKDDQKKTSSIRISKKK